MADIFEDLGDYQMVNHLGQRLWTVPLGQQLWTEPTLPLFWAEDDGITRNAPGWVEWNSIIPVTAEAVRGWLFSIMERTPNLTWQLLTKRPENVAKMVPADWLNKTQNLNAPPEDLGHWPQNVWLGASVCTRDEAVMVPHELLMVNAPVPCRWLSLEPLLEDVAYELRDFMCAVSNMVIPGSVPVKYAKIRKLNWLVIGGESGAKAPDSSGKARPFEVMWAHKLIELGKEMACPVFFKQVGDNAYDHGSPLPNIETDGGSNPGEWPPWLRVRQCPPVLIDPTRANHKKLFVRSRK